MNVFSTAVIISIIFLTTTVVCGQIDSANWIIGKWKRTGQLYNADNFPDSLKNFPVDPEGYYGGAYHFKKNGSVVCKLSYGDKYQSQRTNKVKFMWKLSSTGDTLYMYKDDIKLGTKFLLKKYSRNEFAMAYARNNLYLPEGNPFTLFKRE